MADNQKLTCPICGEPTHVYFGNARKDRLCPKHGKMAKSGEIFLDPHGRWREAATKNVLTQAPAPIEEPKKEAAVEPTAASDLTCIICGEPSNGKHFCLKCFKKYKEKEILLKINKCQLPVGEPLDESYEGVYECVDGHIVKSISEQVIDDWLCDNGIFHGYEIPLDIGEEKPLKPDFYLKNYLGEGKDVYIEYFGLKGQPKYDETTAFKMRHYKRLGITLICLYPRESKNLKFALQTKLRKDKIQEGQVNSEE